MAEYIDKVEFNYAIREAVKKYPNSFYNGLEVARQIAHDLRAADVRPVVKARWNVGADGWECSNCAIESNNTYPICPYCGAMMEES